MTSHAHIAIASLLFFCLPVGADSPSSHEVLEAVKGGKGLCVHLSCGKGKLTAEIARGSPMVIHALDSDAQKVDAARAALREVDKTGRVSIEQWSQRVLPYPENFVNIIVAQEGLAVPEEELLRVLCPNGLGLVQKGDGWKPITKPRPQGMGEWTHQKHGPDGNPVAEDTIPMRQVPDRFRWVSNVLEVWSHAVRTAGDRTFLFVNDTVSAHDAYNGVLLWSRSYEGVKTNSRPSSAYNRPVVTSDRVYVYNPDGILAINAATGDIAATFTEAGRPVDFVLTMSGEATVLLCREPEAVTCLDALTGRVRWRVEAPMNPVDIEKDRKGRTRGFKLQHVFAANGRVFFATGEKRQTGERVDRKGVKTPVYAFKTQLVGVDIASGRKARECEDSRLGDPATIALYAAGVLVGFNTDCYWGAPTDGKGSFWTLPVKRWNRQGTKLQGEAFREPKRALVSAIYAAGLFWVRDDSGTVYGEKELTAPEKKTRGWLGIDPRSGNPRRKVGYPVDMKWSGRCYDDIATADCILAQTMEIVSLGPDKDLKHIRGVRGQCGIGFIIGNHTVYTPPNMCIGCYPMIRGLASYDVPGSVRLPVDDRTRLERGPAYGALKDPVAPRSDDWPLFRYNALRTGSTPMALEPGGLKKQWTTEVGGRCTQPIVSSRILVTALIDTGQVVALDAQTGKRLWKYSAGSRIDTSPTLHGALCLFGCHDGYVYCLRARDGALVWRANAAPEHRRVVSGGCVESAWPVMGSVLVYDNVAYALSGHYSAIDGHLHFWAFDPQEGSVLFHRIFSGIKGEGARILPTHWYQHEDHALNNVLLAHDGRLRLYEEWGGWEFDAKDGKLRRQLLAVPQPGWPKGRVSPGAPEDADRWPWCGYDRVSIAYMLRCEKLSFFRTLEMDPRTRFSGTRGQFLFFPEKNATGVLLRVRDNTTRITPEPWVVPTDLKAIGFPEEFAKDPRVVAGKAKLWSSRVLPLHAQAVLMTAKNTLWVAGTTTDGLRSEIRTLSMQDGKELAKLSFSGEVTFEGLSAAGGNLYIATRDGRILCFGKR